MQASEKSCVWCGWVAKTTQSRCSECGGALVPVSLTTPINLPLPSSVVYAYDTGRFMSQIGLVQVKDEGQSWSRKIGDYLVNIQATGDGTWWLTAVCGTDDPALEYSGHLGGCVMQYAAVVTAIQAGVFGGR